MVAIALTGGPGAGKTAVIDALGARGYSCVPESARAIIRERLDRGLSPRPPPGAFAEQALKRDTDQYRRMAQAEGPVFFDRCILDALGMLDELGVLSAVDLKSLLGQFPYSKTAFIFPPWPEIYTTDTERDQTFEHAIVVHQKVRNWYLRCGYGLLEVPQTPVAARCDFILGHLR